MYFKNRQEAGRKLVEKLINYRGSNCAVIALSPGGVLVGAQIAESLHTNLMLLLTEPINIPGENEPIAAMGSDDMMTYNSMYSVGEIEEFNMDYYSYIEQERIEKLHDLHLMLGQDGEIHKKTLAHHVVILVSDSLNSGFSLDVSASFLKSVSTKKILIATPLATPEAYDRMRMVGDEVFCLNIVENYLGTNHYYDDNNIPKIEDLLTLSSEIALRWQR